MHPFNKIFRRPCLLLAILLHLALHSMAQENIFIPRRYFGFTLTPAIAAKANVSGNSYYKVNTSPQLAAEASINLYYDFAAKWTMCFGIGAGMIGSNFDFVVPGKSFDPPLEYDIINSGQFSRELDAFQLRIPFSMQRNFYHAEKQNYWSAALGACFIYSPAGTRHQEFVLKHENGDETSFLQIEKTTNNYGRAWFNYFATAGYSWHTRSKNLIRAELKYNHSFTEFIKGSYAFQLPNAPEATGDYGVTGTFLGISITYLLKK